MTLKIYPEDMKRLKKDKNRMTKLAVLQRKRAKKYTCPTCGEEDTILFCCECAWKHFYEKGRADTIKEVEKIVKEWYDVGMKSPNSRLQLMATNGGYINKFELIKEIEKLLSEKKRAFLSSQELQ